MPASPGGPDRRNHEAAEEDRGRGFQGRRTVTDQAAADQAAEPRDPVIAKVLEQFGDLIIEASVERDQTTLVVDGDNVRAVARFLRDEPDLAFVRLVDICGADFLDVEAKL